jgi:glycosyltransferase involved in cell wall biosynthesis
VVDKSSDATLEICKEYNVDLYTNERPTGFVAAWNRAARFSNGDFVTILHQDDLLDPDYLETVEQALMQYPRVGHLYVPCRYIDQHGNIDKRRTPMSKRTASAVLLSGSEYATRYLQGVFTGRHIHRCPGVMTRRELLLNSCQYREEAGHIADDDFFYRIGNYTDIICIPRILASYREHSKSATGSVRIIEITLARDYLFQIRQEASRAHFSSAEVEEIFEQLAIKSLWEAMYHTLLLNTGEWGEVLEYAYELEAIRKGAFQRHMPVLGKLIWFAVQRDDIESAKRLVGVRRFSRGFIRRLRALASNVALRSGRI